MRRHVLLGTFGAGLAVIAAVVFVPAASKAPPRAAAYAPQPLCAAGEQVLFQCRIGSRTASVCAGQADNSQFVQYRFGKPGDVELAYPAPGSDGLSWARTGYSGGGELQLNFSEKAHRYVLYSRVVRTGFPPGPNAPRFEAGIAVVRNNKIISDRPCSDTDNPFLGDPERVLPEGEFTQWWDLDD